MLGLGSNSVLGIGLRVSLLNHFSGQAAQVVASMGGMQNAAKQLRASFESMQQVGLGMGLVGYAITNFFGAAIKSGMKFEHTMVAVGAVSGATGNQLKQLRDTASGLSRVFPYMQQEIAEGMERIAKGGIRADAIPELTKTFLAAATAAREQFGGDTGVAEMMTDMMQAWNLSPEKAKDLGNMFTTAALESTTSFRQIYESFTYSQDTFKNLNLSLAESLSLVAMLGNQGIKASRAGIALQNMYKELTISITRPTPKKLKAFAQLGLDPASLADAQGNVQKTLVLFSMMKESMRGMSSLQREGILGEIFGVRGKRAITPLTAYLEGTTIEGGKSVTKSLRELQADIIKGNTGIGSMATLNEMLLATPETKVKLLANAFAEMKIAMYEALPILIPFVKALTSVIHGIINFVKTPMGGALVSLLAILGPVLIVMGALNLAVGTAGLFMLNLTKSSVGFGKAAKWVWNTAAVHALRYLGITRAINASGAVGGLAGMFGRRFNSVGSLIGPDGRIILTQQTISKFGMFGSVLGRISPMLTKFLLPVAGLVRLAGPIGIITIVMQTMGIRLKSVVQFLAGSVLYPLYTVGNLIMGLIELLTPISFGGGGFFQRQKSMFDTMVMGGIRSAGNDMRGGPAPVSPVSPTENKGYENKDKFFNLKPTFMGSPTVINIYQDGKKTLTKHINNYQENNLSSEYGFG